MKWRGLPQSDNVEDRRGDNAPGGGLGGGFGGGMGGGPFGRGGGGGIRLAGGSWKMMLFLLVLFFILKALGIDATQLLDGGTTTGSNSGYERQIGNEGETSSRANDEMTAFVSTVLKTTEDAWTGIFKASGDTYEKPKLVLFDGQTESACGFASAATGPFYCPGDRKVFLDTAFFQEMADRFGASGEFADAYVIAHEVGHHVQNLLGILPKFNKMRQSMSEVEANRMSVRVELQADCFAGIWARYAEGRGIVEAGDMEAALNAAKQIGDDTLQKRSQGYVVPESFNHGTSEQRMRWLKRGFDTGDLNACDTFSNKI
ncbi:KPN_02809 family neutral zinc metallopeptidase [Gellertiella hungarica]|uniref:Neutral zinc metallopeptidase n=1 Tax=Gellertiella hungarica TaxID=1572859 RepID=A0A7W6J2C7_9HYPH|nr:neutral zinc metallopeptidase [Gellertiella hungarica]MBB4063447.1 hypothetical protein [Gellertiella hungarica]